jgi:hypothetical protein
MKLWTLIVLLVAISARPIQVESWKGKETIKDGTRHVLNPAEGIKRPATIQLEEQWRIGEEGEEQGEIFGLIRGVVVDREGFVYVLDYQLSEVKKFSPDGHFIKTITRQGEGPGELRRPDSICILPSGLVSVAMAYPSRIVRITKEGDFAGSLLMPEDGTGATPVIYDMILAGDHLVLRAAIHETRYLCAIDDQGHETVRYYEEKFSFDDEHPVWEERSRSLKGRWAGGTDGKLYVASSFYDYEIRVYNPTGEIDFVIEREYKRRKRSRDEKQLVYDWANVNPGALLPDTRFEIEEHDKDIMALYRRDNGTCWVLTSRGFYDRPEGSTGVFDVFDGAGRFVRQVTLMGEGDPFRDHYYFHGDRLYIVTCFTGAVATMMGGGKESRFSSECVDPMSVICYQIKTQ